MKGTDARFLIGRRSDGSSDSVYDRTLPTFTAEGALFLSPEDGSVSEPIELTTVDQSVSTLDNRYDINQLMNAMGRPEKLMRFFKFHLVVTDARVVVIQDVPEKPGVRVVGQVRYPWIRTVEYRPKQSFLLDAVIELDIVEDFPNPDDGHWNHKFELTFPKTFDPGPLALDITHRIARHHLKYGAPASTVEKFTALTTTAAIAPPPKGQLAAYNIPAWMSLPEGAEYLGDGRDPAAWTLATG